MNRDERLVGDMLALADVRVGGDRSWDLQVVDPRFFRRVVAGGSLALGESYVDGWWDVPRLDQFFDRVLRAHLDRRIDRRRALLAVIRSRLFNFQNPVRAWTVGRRHYDLGNDLFELMLDRRMVYSCGFWEQATDLDAAQEAKLELVCRKIGLREGQHVLDVGCGWGSFAQYAAERYGARVTGVTISTEQAALARERCAGLPVEIRLQDYRDIDQRFDHVVSIGMFEHVGARNYANYLDVVRRCLQPGGLFLLHTIGGNVTTAGSDPWVAKYIFPNGQIPSLTQLARASEKRMVIEDLHNFGPYYDLTLMAWYRNFVAGWPRIAERYGERFERMWRYYLLCCAGAFRARDIQLWQVVMSGEGAREAYRRPVLEPQATPSRARSADTLAPGALLH